MAGKVLIMKINYISNLPRVMFFSFGIFGLGFYFIFFIIYHLILKRFEIDQRLDMKDNEEEVVEKQKDNSEDADDIYVTGRMVSTDI